VLLDRLFREGQAGLNCVSNCAGLRILFIDLRRRRDAGGLGGNFGLDQAVGRKLRAAAGTRITAAGPG
jgi:hypothetical protein